MLRNAFVILLAIGMLFGGLLPTANAATPAQANAAIAARQAALAQAAAAQTGKKHHKRHHHHKKGTAQLPPAIK